MAKVLVTGGTGTLGRHLLPRLAADHSVRVLTRRGIASTDGSVRYIHGDLVGGTALMEATHAVDAIVHCASEGGRNSRKIDIEGTRRLLEGAKQSGATPHLIYISIVGVDRHPFRYYRAKRAAELAIERSGLPYTILRTTQWHELMYLLFGRATTMGMTLLPKDFRVQPLAASEAAARLVRCVGAKPAGLLPDMAGPEIRAVDDLARSWMKAVGTDTRLVRCPVPGRVGRAFREGINLAPDRAVGRMTWESWLAKNVARPEGKAGL